MTLVLYSRPGCHLCEEMLAELEPLLEGRADVRIVDVSGDPELERRYGLRIPVLVAGDIELSEHPLDRERVERMLSRRPV
ncbi:MAG TPA: glutaredoxin family protein [Gammaproteobacteria bacterium]